MDGEMFDMIHQEHTPKITPDIGNGLACNAMNGVERYIDKIIKSASPGFPEGLEYGWKSKGGLGLERCTPLEEYRWIIDKRNNRSTYELARSDVYMVKLYFTFKGEELAASAHSPAVQKAASAYLWLPYVRDGGIISLRGATYAISPVLARKAISMGLDSMFVALTRTKMIFERRAHHFYGNDDRQTVNVVYSVVHHEQKSNRSKPGQRSVVNGQTTMVHYLLGKYGLTEMFRRFTGAQVMVGNSETINENTHPTDQWVICRSTELKPRTLRVRTYIASDYRIAVPKPDFENDDVKNLIGGVFYIVDHFPQQVDPEFADNEIHWRIMLSQLIKSDDSLGHGKLMEFADAHYASLDEYIDDLSKIHLTEEGVPCDDIYELFFYAIQVLSQVEPWSQERLASMYDKDLMVLRFVLFDVTTDIFKFMYNLRKITRNEVKRKDVVDGLRKFFKPDQIFKLAHKHAEVNGVSSPGDNKIFKITSVLVQQTSTTTGGRNRNKSNLVDDGKYLHASIAEVANFGFLPKSSPDGRGRLNPFFRPGPNFSVQPNADLKPLLDSVQAKIRR